MEKAFEKSAIPWWYLLVEGIAAIVAGVLLLMIPSKMSVLLVQVLSIYWLIQGIVSIISMFIDSSAWGWKLFIGIVGVIAGYVLIQHHIGGRTDVTTAFTVVLGIQGIIVGIIGIVQAFQGGGQAIGVIGALSVIIGVWLLLNALLDVTVLAWLLGVLAIIGGIYAVVMELKLK
jgi:uncharacterized membrane protein HdeD (DUF308 family)